MAQRSGLSGFVRDMGLDTDASGLLAGIVKWFVRLIVLVAAFDALGLMGENPDSGSPSTDEMVGRHSPGRKERASGLRAYEKERLPEPVVLGEWMRSSGVTGSRTTRQPDRVNSPTLDRFKRWFWRRPRAHGDTILDRRVSPLESLYDLVYAVVISQAALPLDHHVSARQTVTFAVVFGLIWIAWTDGSLYLELHGREDGRTRAFVFLQIGILTLVAVFAGTAASTGGRSFALAYAAFLTVTTWMWYAVQRQDQIERPEFADVTSRYVTALVLSVATLLVSAILPPGPRLIVWAALSVAWIVLVLFLFRARVGQTLGITPTDSLVERFGLFTLIVLGGVVFSVVAGLSATKRDASTIATGMVALVVGFGLWWIYFDVVGGRLPDNDGRAIANWIVSHCPITLSIAAAGAGMIGLIEHAHDARTPATTAWLLAGAVAVGLLTLIVTANALTDARRLESAYRPLTTKMAIGAVAAVLVGWARPAPWLLALLLVVILSALWAVAVHGFLLVDAWGEEAPRAD